ncbi:hypothetical protein OU994_27720 [Pseudoduganella sp. SL102]|uniref:hypothetical protein n=1 Tax=Pseudoduganella sp. SL102 TaxID=2995154 RepID=UPI00248B2560|nr:hypothetical protein [Pseudoduganella sp. SL102]WBS02000.1 hypothetical protein OU994_27720 [Pseudoduganella sp. SL102]
MFVEPSDSREPDQQRVEAIVAQGPRGAFAVAGTAVAIVLAIWLAFYLLVFVARGGA